MPVNFEMIQKIPSLRFFLSLNTDLTSLVISLAQVTLASLALLLAFLTSSTNRRWRYRALNGCSPRDYFQYFLGSPYLFGIKMHHFSSYCYFWDYEFHISPSFHTLVWLLCNYTDFIWVRLKMRLPVHNEPSCSPPIGSPSGEQVLSSPQERASSYL